MTEVNDSFTEPSLKSETIFKGNLLTLQIDTVKLANGKEATREIVRHPGAVSILAFINDKILVVEQFRKPLAKKQIEIPAGKLHAGENPEKAAYRELREETGYTAKQMRHLHTFATSPGFCDEVIHFYLAEQLEFSGVQPDEDEFLTCSSLSFAEAETYLAEGKITDAKTLLALYIWRVNRLRGSV